MEKRVGTETGTGVRAKVWVVQGSKEGIMLSGVSVRIVLVMITIMMMLTMVLNKWK